MNEPPCQQQVFAYLPLRNYGFRFVVQADFVVPSSREDVDRDNTWNEWLRSEIPSLFIEAFDRLKHASSPDEFMPIGRMFQFIPAEGEVTGFFQSVGRSILCMPRTKADFEFFLDIITAMKKNLCMPTADGLWVLPSQTVAIGRLMHLIFC